MPHASLKLIPGVDQTRTEALNEAALWESNLIRFMPDRQGQGLPQKLGGWTQFIPTSSWDTVRALHAWADTNTNNYLAVGSENSLWASEVPSDAKNLNPQYYTANIPVSVSTVVGSADVTITDTGSNITSFDSVYISTPISVGGIILSGYYSAKASGANTYVVTARNIIGTLTPATNILSVTTIATTGTGPYTATVVHTAGYTVPVGATVTFTGAGSFAGPYTVLTSSSGTFTFSTATNLGSASSGTFVASALTGGAVPTFSAGSSTATVTVTLANHGYSVGSTFAALASTTIGGVTIYGNYIVTSVISSSQFTINAGTAPANSITITSASWAASVATIGINSQITIPVGTSVVVAGMTPSGYNGTYTVTVSSAGSFKYALASNPGTATVFGTVTSPVYTVSMNNGKAQIIYFIGQTATPPTVGYGSGGYGAGGYGTGVLYSGAGRTYTGTTVSTVAGITTVTIPNTIVYITPGSIVQDATPTRFTVTSAVSGPTNSTFTFTGTPSGTTFSVYSWGFQMPLSTNKDWSLDNWGEYLIASPHNGEIFFWNPADTNGHVAVVPNAPLVNEGCFVAMPERQIIAYGSTFTGFQDPLLVRWCDIGNFTNWIGTVVNQAGSYRIPKGSKIVGGIQGPQQGLLWTDLGLWAMQYVNLPLVYNFNEIASGCGLVGRKAMGTLAGTVYWMSQSQFFRLSGNGVEPIDCPIWDVVFQDIDTSYWENVRCAPNSRFGEITWYYPIKATVDADGNPVSSSGGIPTKYVKYNALLNQWDYGTLTRTAWIDQSIFGPPIGAGSDLLIYQHETSNDANGVAMNSSFQTGYFAIQDGDLKTFVDQVWPDMKWGLYEQAQNATVTITFYTADYPGDTPKSYSYTVTQGTQFVTPRLRARLVAIKIESNDIGSFWRVGNIRYCRP